MWRKNMNMNPSGKGYKYPLKNKMIDKLVNNKEK